MATERTQRDPRIAAQAVVLKEWGQSWRRTHGASQQDLGRAAGYGSEASPKSAAVAVSRIEAGKTEPTGRYRAQLLTVLGRSEADLTRAVDEALASRQRPGALARAMAGPVFAENEARRARIVAASNALTQRVEFQSRTAEQVFERARVQFVLPFLELAATIDGRPLLRTAAPEAPSVSARDGIRELREQTRVAVLRAIGDHPGSPAAALAAVSASSAASTGAAIASLSGAAPTSATLSWLGRGSFQTAGWGVAGGTAVLTGVVALPALLALGAVLVWRGRRLRREAEAEVEKLDAAQQALEDMEAAVTRAEVWAAQQQEVIQRAGLIGAAMRSWLAGPTAPAGTVSWTDLPEGLREVLDGELDLVSIILDAHALPLWLGVASVGQPDLTDEQAAAAAGSEEWIRETLTLAAAELDEREAWLRARLQPR